MSDDRLKRKIEETTALQIARRARGGVHDRMGLSTRGTKDAFVEAQMIEQPVPVEPGAEQDVIVQPTTPPDMGGAMQPPEEPVVPGEEDPSDEEPETDVDEEMKRSLFNTLSELIDLGRIGRNEQEIRQYVDEHEDEIGELIDVLDDVVDMLIGEGTVMREPKTFDVGDEEQPPTDEGGFDETKPGVGGQVPQGGTTTTVIASDQSKGNGDALHESIMTKITSGADIDMTLERAAEDLNEKTTETAYEFASPEDLNRAMEVLDGLDVATTNVMKVGPTAMTLVRDERNEADVQRQLSAIRNAGIKMDGEIEPTAAEGIATPAGLVSGPNVGQRSTVQSEAAKKTNALDPDEREKDCPHEHGAWSGKIPNTGTFKCKMCGTALDPDTKKPVSEGIFSDWYVVSQHEGGASAAKHGMDKDAAKQTAQGLNASNPKANALVVRASSEKGAIEKYERRTSDVRSPEARAERGQRGVSALKTVGKAVAAPFAAAPKMAGAGIAKLIQFLRPAPGDQEPEASAVEPTPAGAGVEHPENAIKVTVSDPTEYSTLMSSLVKNAGTRYASGDGENVWIVSEDPQVNAILGEMSATAQANEGYQSWDRPVMRVRAAMGEGVDPSNFNSVTEAEAYAQDLRDLGYRGVVLEELNVTRTGMAVEVVFGNKQQASAAKGALFQYKGIDTVKDAENGTLVVFTTDADPEEARNRVTTILQNARVPMEDAFEITRWKLVEMVVEANPGGQSAIGGPVPGISRGYNGPDLMPTPVPTAGGQSGADLEAEGEKCPHCGGTYQDGICINCKRIKKTPARVDYREMPGDRQEPRRAVATEQAGPQDPGEKAKFMQPFYAPDDAGLPPGPEGDAVPGPDDPDFEEPDYGEEAGEAPEELAGGALWRLDIPEAPEEMEQLTDALNQAKEAGVVASWTEIGAPEEGLPPEAGAAGDADLDADVELEVTPEFTNEPAPVSGDTSFLKADELKRFGEQAGDEYDLPPGEPPAVADVEPGGAPVDELPPEEPLEDPLEEPGEEDEHYIAVEFSAETEQEERERFPDWITDVTADPDTGEGGLLIAGWKADEGGEETPEGLGDEIPGEIPGESLENSPELSPEFSEESIPMVGAPSDEVPVPREEKLLGEDYDHLRNIYRAARVAEARGDEANCKRFIEALVRHGHGRRVTRVNMARILRESEAKLESVYPELKGPAKPERVAESTVAERVVSEVPVDLWRLVEDHDAMLVDGDEVGARRVMNELRFRAEAQDVSLECACVDPDDDGVAEGGAQERLTGRINYLSKRAEKARQAGNEVEAKRIEAHVASLVAKAKGKGGSLGMDAEGAQQAGVAAAG